ncbi:endonuclease V [Pavlovales sp. CCMP2436]|nr:endonuclease V [Pavlovales sp. CCMP2436]
MHAWPRLSAALSAARLCARKVVWWCQQRFLRQFVVEIDLRDPATIRLVAGVDISFVKGSATDACAGLVVCELPSLRVVYARCERISLREPYIPGYLAFREVPFLLQLLRVHNTERPELNPELVLVDGNGILHPHRFGLACHLGVLCGTPTVGVAKSLHCVDGLTTRNMRELTAQTCTRAGDSALLVGDSGAVWGAALRTTDLEGGFSPVIVSVGHGLSLSSAVELVRRCSRHRVPEPIRQADLRSREWLRAHAPTS